MLTQIEYLIDEQPYFSEKDLNLQLIIDNRRFLLYNDLASRTLNFS